MGISLITAICSLAASIYLLFDTRARGYGSVTLMVSGVQIAITRGLVRLQIVGVPLGKVLPAILLLVGALILFQAQSKSKVAAATVILMSGAIQLLLVLKLI